MTTLEELLSFMFCVRVKWNVPEESENLFCRLSLHVSESKHLYSPRTINVQKFMLVVQKHIDKIFTKYYWYTQWEIVLLTNIQYSTSMCIKGKIPTFISDCQGPLICDKELFYFSLAFNLQVHHLPRMPFETTEGNRDTCASHYIFYSFLLLRGDFFLLIVFLILLYFKLFTLGQQPFVAYGVGSRMVHSVAVSIIVLDLCKMRY